ncbi:flavin-dependent dehydrogenase [Branchiibius hedensis]|uniref:Dehydrogenase (Flavoprotein) n=1 Tax=Branchiibius hedensis TaxID=672460 RepID=A0A2Y9BMS3_9MICO|nr:flavin-dependent dehydrogenase [Branchiibius hedensis]SSA59003.1 Dehydrogenase (flavoprotein) [Branchiibius hedensis]
MVSNVDAIVVGGRCAGAATALSLAESGHRVLMVEAARWPSDTMSTLYIHQPGVVQLARVGVLDDVLASGCPTIISLNHHVGGVTVSGSLPLFDGVGFALAPRRYVLDSIMVAKARELGVDFRQRTRFVGALWDGGRVVGARLAGDEVYDVRCAVLVGADGMRSRVAKAVSAPIQRDDGRRTFVHYTGWRDLGRAAVEIHEASGRYASVIPTHDRTWLVATYGAQAAFAKARRNPLQHHLDTVRQLDLALWRELERRDPVVRLHGSGDQKNFVRRPCGPGWALVGDAGHHKDSITARGITDALRQAESLGHSLSGRLSSREATDAGLRDYAVARNALIENSYAQTLSATRLDVSKSRLQRHRLVAGSADLTQHHLRVLGGIATADDLTD